MDPAIEMILHGALWTFTTLAACTLFSLGCITIGAGRSIVIAAVIAIATAYSLAASHAKADCHAFYRKQVVYQQQVAYVQPIVYAPLVFYQAGDELRIQAAVKRELEYQQNLQAPSKGYQSPQQAPVQAPIQVPQKGSLEPLQNVEVGLFARCIRCHKGQDAAAGLRFDGDYPTTHENYANFGKIFGIGGNYIPTKMVAVVPAVTPQERGDMNEWILRRIPEPAQPTPPADRPPPPPVPQDGGLQ